MKESKLKNKKLDLIEDGNLDIDDQLLKKYQEKTAQTINKITNIGLPKKGEQIRLITMKSFNSIAFIQLIAEKEGISKCVLVIFAINIQAAKILLDLFDRGLILNLELVVSSVRNAGYSIKSKAVELLSQNNNIKLMFVNSHAKISAICTQKGNNYVIEGSGNFSYNGRIEQYIIDNDVKLFNFTENWIDEIKSKMKTKDLLIVNK